MTDMFTTFDEKVIAYSRWAGDTHYDDKTGFAGGQTSFGALSTQAKNNATSVPASGGFTGSIDARGEIDTYRIQVTKDALYTVNLNGVGTNPLSDTFVVVFDDKGKLLGYDDDGGVGLNSLLTFRAKSDGLYYVQARSFSAPDQPPSLGSYQLNYAKMGADEAGSGLASAKALAVDSSILGFTQASGETDVYKITLEAGEYYEFQVAGGADYEVRLKDANGKLKLGDFELDTRIRIFDGQGNLVAENDDLDFPSDLSSALAFAPKVAGDYYIQIAPYGGDPGGYNLQAKKVELEGLDPRDTIDWGTKLASNQISVYFAKTGETFDGVTSLGWTAYEIQQALVAFQQYENIINVDFTVVDSPLNATLKLVVTEGDGPLGYFNPPGETNEGVGVFWRDGYGWEEGGEGGLEQGGYGFITLIHELGHGLGLAHPHDNGGTSQVLPGAFGPFNFYGAFDLNQGVYSTMSYNDGWQLHPDAVGGFPAGDPTGYGYQGTMMALDISVLQEKYGAVAHNAGDTVYALKDVNAVGTFYATIWDTGGKDTIAYSGSADAVIDLRAATLDYSFTGAGALSWVDGIYGGYTIAAGAVIENAVGGSGDDTLIGNAAANQLTGGAGADTFVFNTADTGDVILDFLSNVDKIDLRAIDANTSAAGDQAFAFIGDSAFSGAAGQLRAFSFEGDTVVEGDVNGDGVADLRFVLDNSTAGAGDFWA